MKCNWNWAGVFLFGLTLVRGQTNVPTTRFEFREPRRTAYRVETPRAAGGMNSAPRPWLRAWPAHGAGHAVEFGSRVVLQLRATNALERLLQGRPLRLARRVTENLFVLQAPDAGTAVRQAQELARAPEVQASCPVMRRHAGLHGPYAARPNDAYFVNQWHLENRDSNGVPVGVDLNVRAAWPFARGDGVVVAVADDGVEVTHPDLAPRLREDLQYNFVTGETNGMHPSDLQMHGTAVAGLAVAEGNNHQGIIGVAYRAQLASWVIWDSSNNLVNDEPLAQMFEYQSNVVSVQNHSWGNIDVTQLDAGLLEKVAISNAVLFGRNGLGVVMVRSGGNGREAESNVNDDGYALDPKAIAVAAVRADGRVASYSTAGAPLLVAAPSGDPNTGLPPLFTTDRLGTNGYNRAVVANSDSADYTFGAEGQFSGTSGSAPQIAGIAALILSANPNLSYRDVQQIFINASHQTDAADPDVATNGAGFLVSHNTGFGVPDAAFAVRLARQWPSRPAATHLTLTLTNVQAIPDDGLRLLIRGPGVPDGLNNLHTLPSFGPHPDAPTAVLPLVDLGLVTNPITTNLAGKAALIERGLSLFSDKITWAAQAGAAFAVIYNNVGATNLIFMAGTEFTPIPAVFIDQLDGEALSALLATNSGITAQVHLDTAAYSFVVTNTLLCEHVGVRLMTDHPRRADVRITLLSPQGTRSVLAQLNEDASPGPADWTYYSTHHFYESSWGTWTLFVSDEQAGATGSVQLAGLTIEGVPITDTDHDGLDDHWETNYFGTLAFGPKDDPTGDGFNNMRKQILGLDPTVAADLPLQLDLSAWDQRLARLSWLGSTNWTYQLQASASAAGPFMLLTNLSGHFPETEWFTSYTGASNQFFRVVQTNAATATASR